MVVYLIVYNVPSSSESVIKHKCPDFNRLSRRRSLWSSWIFETSMRCANSNPSILGRIETIYFFQKHCQFTEQSRNNICFSPFDQNKFFWLHSFKIFPLVFLIVLDSKRFTFTVRKNKLHRDYLTFEVNAPKIAERQWPIDSRSSNRSPEVDYLKTTFKKFRNVGGRKMSMDPCDS